MGRVKRYKKVKSCDPFSKQFNRREVDNTHDEPPTIFEERTERIAKKSKRLMNNEMLQLRKMAKKIDPFVFSSAPKVKEETKKIEGKRDDESMKSFKKRLRQETRETLRNEIKGLTSTAQKKKRRLKERKQQRKKGKHSADEKVSSHDKDVFDREFGASETGQLRPSDMDGAKINFEDVATDEIKFGERVEAPPDLRFAFSMAGARKIGLGSSDGSTAGKRFAEEQKKRNKASHLSAPDERIRVEGTLYDPGQKASSHEVEVARNNVIAAYKDLQKKRKENLKS